MVELAVAGPRVLIVADGKLEVRELASGDVVHALEVPKEALETAALWALDHDGHRVAFGRGSITIVALESCEQGAIDDDGALEALAFARDGRVLAARKDKLVRVWHPDGTLQHERRLLGHGSLDGVSFSADGRLCFAVSSDKVSLFDLDAGMLLARGRMEDGPLAETGAMSEDGRAFCTVHADGSIRAWFQAKETLHARLLTSTTGTPRRVHVSGHGGWVAVETDHHVSVQEVEHGSSAPVVLPAGVTALALGADRTVVVATKARVEAHGPFGVRWSTAGLAPPPAPHPTDEVFPAVGVARDEETDDPDAEPNKTGGSTVPGLGRWPKCAECEEAMTLVAHLAADPVRLPLKAHAGVAAFACLQGCVTFDVKLTTKKGKAARAPRGAESMPARALRFWSPPGSSGDGDEATFGGPATWEDGAVPLQTCPECAKTMLCRAELRPSLFEDDIVDALGDFGWLFVCPAEHAGSLVFWSY